MQSVNSMTNNNRGSWMNRFIKRVGLSLAAVIICTLSALTPLHAATPTAEDEQAVQTVIKSQLAAFAADDADKAFSFAAPELRQAIGNADAFMAMVKSSYQVVYRPASVAFLKSEGSGDDVVQKVQMLDASGTSYLAVYSLQRQKDKTWRISGCAVAKSNGQMT